MVNLDLYCVDSVLPLLFVQYKRARTLSDAEAVAGVLCSLSDCTVTVKQPVLSWAAVKLQAFKHICSYLLPTVFCPGPALNHVRRGG